MKLVIDIPEEHYNEIVNIKSIPDLSGVCIVNTLKSITKGKCMTCCSKDCVWNENDKCQCDNIELGNYAECLMWSEEDNE